MPESCDPDNFDFVYQSRADDPVRIALPKLEEVPATELERCQINCALLARHQAEQCIKLRKQVSLWLEKEGCPTILEAIKQPSCGTVNITKRWRLKETS